MENFQINIHVLPWKWQIMGAIGLPLIPLELLRLKQLSMGVHLRMFFKASKKSSLYLQFGTLKNWKTQIIFNGKGRSSEETAKAFLQLLIYLQLEMYYKYSLSPLPFKTSYHDFQLWSWDAMDIFYHLYLF